MNNFQNVLDFRASVIKSLFHEFSSSVVTVSLNIPSGSNPSCVLHIFREAERVIRREVSSFSKGHFMSEEYFWAAYALDIDDSPIHSIKERLIQIEETHPLGRLFDFDLHRASSANLTLIDRESLGKPLRKCFLCNEPAIICRRQKNHGTDDLAHWISTLVNDFVHRQLEAGNFLKVLHRFVCESVIEEAVAIPKPGLVDGRGSGVHSDMDLPLLITSAFAIGPHILECGERGVVTGLETDLEPSSMFSALKVIGLNAERDMFSVTNGVNTHKGMIFSLGLLSAAAGFAFGRNLVKSDLSLIDFGSLVCDLAGTIVFGIVDSELKKDNHHCGRIKDSMAGTGHLTKGEMNFIQFGSDGVRGEASRGFPSIVKQGLPQAQYCLVNGMKGNRRTVRILLAIMSTLDDGNVLAKGGRESLARIKQLSTDALLEDDGTLGKDNFTWKTSYGKLESYCSLKGISSGGSADMTAAVLLLSSMWKHLVFRTPD